MIYLLLSIASSSIIFVVFKLFSRFKINTLHAIVVNYFTASTLGLLLYNGAITITSVPQQDWFFSAVALGFLFILIFNLMALTTQRSGLSVVSVATKMSVVIPILFGILYYKESLGFFKTTGIIIALIAVYLASIKSKDGIAFKKTDLIFPVLVFLGSGAIDTSIKYLEGKYLSQGELPIFLTMVFGTAGVIGVLIIVGQILRKRFTFDSKNIIAGICLGIPNYGSMYFLVKALRNDAFDSSTIFTINNVGVVMISTLLGILLFTEKLHLKNWIGIALAVISIIFVSLS
ncbi:DMT family transporter [uncultured Dokdonia sp.]|uniref:DMT family transporter n=1 Tax=uncultured Dokdonia sp. TaxID=575653 RepID=UPI00261A7C55|nr:DMT family transporter [uncultured Dokdonia sp.]